MTDGEDRTDELAARIEARMAEPCMEIMSAVLAKLPPEAAREIAECEARGLAAYVSHTTAALGYEAWPLWRDALSAWARESKDAAHSSVTLVRISHRLGAWCACAVARDALRRRRRRGRHLAAVETAERWVIGKATAEECRKASDASIASVDIGSYSRSSFATAAFAAGYTAAYGATAPVYAADVVQAALADSTWAASGEQRDAALCTVIADAILTMPWHQPGL